MTWYLLFKMFKNVEILRVLPLFYHRIYELSIIYQDKKRKQY